ncbi:hypothetical protein IFM47457_08523 [Aspergillus lentulus]|nr:hypothetical protein IFM47457_08523 [Aspergillus lentulus]
MSYPTAWVSYFRPAKPEDRALPQLLHGCRVELSKAQANHTASCHSTKWSSLRSSVPASRFRMSYPGQFARGASSCQANVASEDILLGASSMKYVWIVMD